MTAREIVEKWVDFPLQEMAEMRADIEALVEAEREACAKICDDIEEHLGGDSGWAAVSAAAEQIRARGGENV